MDCDRNVFLGLLSWQCGFVSKEQLVAAFRDWTTDREQAIEALLRGRGALTAQQVALLLQLEQEILAHHGQSARQSLAALSSIGSVRQELEGLGDAPLNATLAHVAKNVVKNAEDTSAFESELSGKPTRREGMLRYRTIRLHAKGGLGEVFVARDEELNREVALKEIQERFADSDESRARFKLEAEITGNLEHPGIVPVYGLGQYDDGRPYYAMRFIRGDSLKEAIDGFHSQYKDRLVDGEAGLELRKLLRRFVDVCNAMAYAHSRGVLHRDLKPGNIVLGKYGETLVVDWGLAKAQGQSEVTDASIGPVTPSSGSGATPTLMGSAVGTPAYMSPEQAAGRLAELGPATDVYALGATLFHLLTGQLPIAGKTPLEIVKKAEAGEIRRPRELRADVPRSLEAVCLKAMAKTPDERYSSPSALAEDLEKWLADEPVSAYVEPLVIRARRWIRRHPAIVSTTAACVALGLCAALVVAYLQGAHAKELAGKNSELTIAKNKAEEAAKAEGIAKADAQNKQELAETERTRAEQREQEAIDAVKRFGDAVAGNPELKNSPKLETLRKELLKEPLGFFKSLRERLARDQSTRPDFLERLSLAAFELGNLTAAIGDKQDAMKSLEEAKEIESRLTLEYPTVIKYQVQLSRYHNNIANLQRDMGNFDGALKSYEIARDTQKQLLKEAPAIAEFRGDLAKSFNNIGMIYRQLGRAGDSLEPHQAAKKIQLQLVSDSPNANGYQFDLASSHNNLSLALRDLGQYESAVREQTAALTIWKRLVDQEYELPDTMNFLAVSHYNLGILHSVLGNPKDAQAEYETARELLQLLALKNATSSEIRSNLAKCSLSLGLLLRNAGKTAAAIDAFESARAISQRLVEENSTVADYWNSLADVHTAIGISHQTASKPSEALASHRSANAIYSRLAQDSPTATEYRSSLLKSHQNVGYLLMGLGKLDEALVAIETSKSLAEQLAKENPNAAKYQNDLAISFSALSSLYRDSGKIALALEMQSKALEILEQLTTQHPAVVEYRMSLARGHAQAAQFHFALGKSGVALAEFESAKSCLEELARTGPKSIELQTLLANCHGDIGLLHNLSNRLEESVGSYESARAIFEGIVQEHPNSADLRSNLANLHNKLGSVFTRIGNPTKASAQLNSAREIQETLARENPRVVQFQSELAVTQNNLALLKISANELAAASELLRAAIENHKRALAANPKNPTYREFLKRHYVELITVAKGLNDTELERTADADLLNAIKSDPRFEALDLRIAAIAGGANSKNVTNLGHLGKRAYDTRQYLLATRLYGDYLESNSQVAEDRQGQVCYNAACSAVLAAGMEGASDIPLDMFAREKLRAQALGWLTSELRHWQEYLGKAGGPAARQSVKKSLEHWQKDSDLASVRESDKLAALPEAERKEWEALWAKVKELLAKAEGPIGSAGEAGK